MNKPVFAASAVQTPWGFLEVGPSAFAAGQGQVRLVDVREVNEFNDALGHVDGAELVPLATLPTVAAGWNRDEAIAVVCRSGGRSARGALTLAQLGFTEVYNVTGGMLGWNAARLPTAGQANSAATL